MNPQERGIRPEIGKRPEQAEAMPGTNDRVLFLRDGRFSVGIEQPPERGKKRGRLAWHEHDDVWSVLNQNERIIQRFLGVPVPSTESGSDSLGSKLVTVPEFKELIMVQGENAGSTKLAQRILDISSQSMTNDINSGRASELLAIIAGRLERARNAHKVAAHQHLTRALREGQQVDITESFQGAQAMLDRASEGIRIVKALRSRGITVLNWAETNETNLLRAEFLIRKALNDIREGRVTSATLAEWDRDFFSDEQSVFLSLDEIKGNPYKKTIESSGIKRLRDSRSQLTSGKDMEIAEEIFGQSYVPLANARNERNRRIESKKYNLYKTPDEVARDKDKVSFDNG